jgi:type IV secretion system protein VirB1
MGYAATTIMALASQCAPTVAPETVLAIVRTESRGDSFALNVNGARQPPKQSNEADAIQTARRYVDAGYTVDMGLGQINSRNMRALGLTWDRVFDPCTNIGALGQILTQNFNAVKAGRDPQAALRIAISLYNTGNTSRGFRNGYVAKVVSNAGVNDSVTAFERATPEFEASPRGEALDLIASENTPPQPALARRRPSPPPAWNVFERAAYDRQSKFLANNERTSL